MTSKPEESVAAAQITPTPEGGCRGGSGSASPRYSAPKEMSRCTTLSSVVCTDYNNGRKRLPE